jgi:type III pantothenate kinase
MVSEHASPLAVLGGVDAGGQNVHVAALASAPRRPRHQVDVYTRRDGWQLPDGVPLCPASRSCTSPRPRRSAARRTSCCPTCPAFGRWLAQEWSGARRPGRRACPLLDVGARQPAGGRRGRRPVVQTFHASVWSSAATRAHPTQPAHPRPSREPAGRQRRHGRRYLPSTRCASWPASVRRSSACA